MNRKITFRTMVMGCLALLFILQIASFAFIARTASDTRSTEKSAESQQLMSHELDAIAQQHALSVLPKENRLYLPELNITVPFNEITRSMRYTYDDNQNARLVSSNMTDHEMHTQSCADMVRLRIESKPDAYSPSQPLYTSVSLSDGRMLQVYASTTGECKQAWVMVTPQQIAEAFKSAQAY